MVLLSIHVCDEIRSTQMHRDLIESSESESNDTRIQTSATIPNVKVTSYAMC